MNEPNIARRDRETLTHADLTDLARLQFQMLAETCAEISLGGWTDTFGMKAVIGDRVVRAQIIVTALEAKP